MYKYYLLSILLVVMVSAQADDTAQLLVAAARERTFKHEIYDGSYRVMAYPMGDVPDDRGVCTDVVIRAYRKVNIAMDSATPLRCAQNDGETI